jgi:hypothetical protein
MGGIGPIARLQMELVSMKSFSIIIKMDSRHQNWKAYYIIAMHCKSQHSLLTIYSWNRLYLAFNSTTKDSLLNHCIHMAQISLVRTLSKMVQHPLGCSQDITLRWRPSLTCAETFQSMDSITVWIVSINSSHVKSSVISFKKVAFAQARRHNV